ncbi:protein of unknown function [Arthrobacter sp. ov407]|uniref:HNH endonuclease signature motif containing protein n=1 Tax=Arthrobacter sp. ov407 TaxID=1761748 RepID=UPI00088BAFDA|nr:HNH endonuclease signature motif containing protein [Arthrobacter sp. ov407]SDL47553.1 protein of unknown function [Arthrobacter sp. ov407]
MEAVRDFIACQDEGQDTDRGTDPAPQSGVGGVDGVDGALAALQTVSATAVEDAGSWGLQEAADFAGQVEELSRTMEYLQLVATAAVDRTRKQSAAAGVAAGAVTSWTTGWRESPGGWETGGSGAAEPPGTTAAAGADASATVTADASSVPASVVDDGYRNTVEFLRARLRIGAAEARRRLSLAEAVLPRQGLAGRTLPPVHRELGAAVAAGEVASRAATVIAVALARVRPLCADEAAARMEHALTRTAAENDADFLVRVTRSWADALDQDGAEPSEELLRQLQGAFIRRRRHGLHHLEIFATTDQFEHLLTVMNTATNPRTGPDTREGSATGPDDAEVTDPDAGTGEGTAAVSAAGMGVETDATASLDLRSRPQKLLDGLVGACKAALATGGLPAAGGLRPQVMATIDYRDLLTRLGETTGATATTGKPGTGTGTLLFTGPVTADTIRKIACDADIIPVVLGGDGQVLDIGRASRVFPPHVRKALTARDRGCAFPQCTIPAPWCEAHHITYWSRGGSTGTDNGTLLCSHHHHLIHKEQWTIQIQTGIPWFIPPPHLDPRRQPRRNHYFRPTDPVTAA